MGAAKKVVLENGNSLKISKSVPSKCGRPVKNSDKHKRNWYKRGPSC